MTKKTELLEFPCQFPLKVVGHANDEFEEFVYMVINKHVPDLIEGAITLRPSKDGTYLAITIDIHAKSKEQLDAIYIELSGSPLVIMAL